MNTTMLNINTVRCVNSNNNCVNRIRSNYLNKLGIFEGGNKKIVETRKPQQSHPPEAAAATAVVAAAASENAEQVQMFQKHNKRSKNEEIAALPIGGGKKNENVSIHKEEHHHDKKMMLLDGIAHDYLRKEEENVAFDSNNDGIKTDQTKGCDKVDEVDQSLSTEEEEKAIKSGQLQDEQRTGKSKKRVTFNEQYYMHVDVIALIPSHRDYDRMTHSELWFSPEERAKNMQRSRLEQHYEEQNLMDAIEEEHMVRTANGEYIHPVTWHYLMTERERRDALGPIIVQQERKKKATRPLSRKERIRKALARRKVRVKKVYNHSAYYHSGGGPSLTRFADS